MFSDYKTILQDNKRKFLPTLQNSFSIFRHTHFFVTSCFFSAERVTIREVHFTLVDALPQISFLILCPLSRSLQHPQSKSMSFYSWKASTKGLNVIIQESSQDTPMHTTVMKLIYHSVVLVPVSYEFLSSHSFVAFFSLYTVPYLKIINPSGQKLHSFNLHFSITY